MMPDPNLNGHDADVVWNLAAFPDQIIIYCVTRAPHEPCEIWERVNAVSKSTHVTDYSGREYLLCRCDGSVIQNCCTGVSLLGLEPVGVRLMITDMQSFPRRSKLLQSAFDVYNGVYPTRPAQWSKTTQILRDGLIALDCLALGGNHRDVAAALYGQIRVREEWNGPSMKHAVRYLVKKAEALRDGGYREDLLRADPFLR